MKKVICPPNLTENPSRIYVGNDVYPNPDLARRVPVYRTERLLRLMRHTPITLHWWNFAISNYENEDELILNTSTVALEICYDNDGIYYWTKNWSEVESDYKLQRQILAHTRRLKVRSNKTLCVEITEATDEYERLEPMLNFASYMIYLFLRLNDKKLVL